MYSVLSTSCTLLILLTVFFSNANSQLNTWTFESNVASARLGGRLTKCDVNADSFLDLVVTGTTSVYVFHGNASGTFSSSPSASRLIVSSPAVVTEGMGIECADLNADGFADVIVGNWSGPAGFVHIFNGSSSGIASSSNTISWSGSNHYFGYALAAADYNGDGKMDLAVGAYGLGRVVIYYGLGATGLNPTPSTQSALYPNVLTYGMVVVACDLSNDGSADLIVTARSMNSSMGQAFVYRNVGGTFQLAHNTLGAMASVFYGYDAGCGDVNGDGNKDVIILSQGDRLLYVYYGTGNVSTLSKPASLVIPLIDAARVINVHDHNLDGYADIIVGFNTLNSVRVLYGGPTLTAASTYGYSFTGSSGSGWSVLGLGNIDGLGTSEIAYGSFAYANGQTSEGLVGIVGNPTPSPTPSVTPSVSSTPSPSSSVSATPTASVTPTTSVTPTASVTPSGTATPTASVTPTASASASATASASVTPSASVDPTPSSTPSRTPSRTPSKSPSPSRTPSISTSPVPSSSPSSTATPSVTSSVTPSRTPSVVSPPPATCSQCQSNADCSNGRGVCVSSSIGNYCSCLSGYGGCDCSIAPFSGCTSTYTEVDTLGGNFQAAAVVDYEYPNLFVSVEANLEESVFGNGGSVASNSAPYSAETIIYFGSSPSAFPECSYPNGEATWQDLAAGASCEDKYLSQITWAFAKDHCGFSAPVGSRNYTQKITILRKYNLGGGIQRTEKTTRNLNVNFPTEIEVSKSNVIVNFPEANAFAALTSIDYDPDTLLWTVVVQTSLNNPYSISAPLAAQYTGNLLYRAPTVSVSGCTPVGSTCLQTITYVFPQGAASDPCLALYGNDIHSFPVQCTTPACPGDNLLNITLTLDTGNACPVSDDVSISQTSLGSFADAALTTTADSFTVLDTLYFGVIIDSTEGQISSKSIKANSVCFQPANGLCYYPQYSVLAPTNGHDPVFQVDLNSAANAAYFSSFSEPTTFSVKSTIVVTFEGAQKSARSNPRFKTIEAVATAVIGGQSSSASAASPMLLMIMLLVSMTALFA